MLRAAGRFPVRSLGLTRDAACKPSIGEKGCRIYVRRNVQVSRPRRSEAVKSSDGISWDVEYSGLWGWLVTFPKRNPFATNCIIATTKTSIADLLVQSAEGKTKIDEIDWKRNSVFTVFGFAYLGVAQWFLYVPVFARLCPNAIKFANKSWAEKLKDKAGQIDLVKQTLLDNFIHYTFIYFPVFYTFKTWLQSTPDQGNTVVRALEKYKTNCVKDNLSMWSLWIPGDLLVYSCPIWMRLPLNHGISFVWTMILSWMRGTDK